MNLIDKIIQDAEKNYIAENGLMRLKEKSKEPPEWPKHDLNGLETVANDNGILFLAYYYALIYYSDNKSVIYKNRKKILDTIESLIRFPHRGLFNREPSADKTPNKQEQHDNYVGIIFLNAVLGLSYNSEIISYGVMNGWNYNNMEPKKFDIKTQRQPGEIAFYQLCHSGKPELVGFFALILGIIVNAFKKDAGQNMLTWLRLFTLELNYEKHSFFVRSAIGLTWAIWYFMMIIKWDDFSNAFHSYFDYDHPVARLSRAVKV